MSRDIWVPDNPSVEEKDVFHRGAPQHTYLIVDEMIEEFFTFTDESAIYRQTERLVENLPSLDGIDPQQCLDEIMRHIFAADSWYHERTGILTTRMIQKFYDQGANSFHLDYRFFGPKQEWLETEGDLVATADYPLHIAYDFDRFEGKDIYVGDGFINCRVEASGEVQNVGWDAQHSSFMTNAPLRYLGQEATMDCDFYLKDVHEIIDCRPSERTPLELVLKVDVGDAFREFELCYDFSGGGNRLYIPADDGWQEVKLE